MSRFKAGDLALIIKAKHPENLGKQVELNFYAESGEEFIWGGERYKPAHNGWVISGNIENAMPNGCAFSPESWLMPLRGDFAPEEMREMEKENA